EKSGAELIRSRAVIENPHRIRLTGQDRAVTARYIIVATGGAPTLDPRIPGIEHVITSNEIFHLDRFPKRILMVGGGYTAVEFAGVFSNLGAETTLLYRGE